MRTSPRRRALRCPSRSASIPHRTRATSPRGSADDARAAAPQLAARGFRAFLFREGGDRQALHLHRANRIGARFVVLARRELLLLVRRRTASGSLMRAFEITRPQIVGLVESMSLSMRNNLRVPAVLLRDTKSQRGKPVTAAGSSPGVFPLQRAPVQSQLIVAPSGVGRSSIVLPRFGCPGHR